MTFLPRVSIVTPCYNGERFIERTIDSVRTQSYAGWEQIVVDDGSTDHSAQLIQRRMECNPRLRLVRQSRGGVCVARNVGYSAASAGSEYLLFLDADDCLEPNALEEMVGYLDAHPEAGMAYCARTFVDADDRPLGMRHGAQGLPTRYTPAGWGFRRMPAEEANTPFASLMAYCLAVPSASLIRRSIIEAVGSWDESLMQPSGAYGDDVDMALRVALVSEVHFIPKLLVRYRRHSANMSNHLDHAGFVRMHRKWWTGTGLKPAQRSIARRAVLFDRKLTAYLQFRGAWEALRSRDLRRASELAFQGTRKIGALVLGYGSFGIAEAGGWLERLPLAQAHAVVPRRGIGRIAAFRDERR